MHEISNVNSYIIGIANNKIKKYYGLKYKFKNMFISVNDEELNIDNIEDIDMNIDEIVIANHDIDKLWEFLKKKKAIVGKIFYLYYTLEYTIKDIAIELNLTESTVKNNLYRTLKEIEITFKEESRFYE